MILEGKAKASSNFSFIIYFPNEKFELNGFYVRGRRLNFKCKDNTSAFV